MNILHIIGAINLEHGGVVRAVIDLAEQTAAAGHGVAVASWDPPDAPEAWRTPGASPRLVHVDAPVGTGRLTPDAHTALRREIDRADAVHLHTPWEPINRAVARICRDARTPYVITLHGMLDDWCMAQKGLKKRAYLALLGGRALLEHAAAVHCTAQAELDQSRKWFPRGTGVVAPLVFDLAPYRDLPGPEIARGRFAIDTAEPVVLFLSRLHVKKGVHLLIKAAHHLDRAGVACTTLIAGVGDDTYTNALRAQISSLGLDARVRLLGMVRGTEKVSLYQAADVFALPTSQENFGFVLPEALACGTPAVTTRGVDIWPELEASGSTAIIEQSAEAFAAAIGELIADPGRRAAMGQAGRRWVLTELDPTAVRARYEQIYAQAAKKPAPAGPLRTE
jgi:glycosyltransferase involved in cell wall biosynthesis